MAMRNTDIDGARDHFNEATKCLLDMPFRPGMKIATRMHNGCYGCVRVQHGFLVRTDMGTSSTARLAAGIADDVER
jgi:hypothetical protein